jgi:hypothetical protein
MKSAVSKTALAFTVVSCMDTTVKAKAVLTDRQTEGAVLEKCISCNFPSNSHENILCPVTRIQEVKQP